MFGIDFNKIYRSVNLTNEKSGRSIEEFDFELVNTDLNEETIGSCKI